MVAVRHHRVIDEEGTRLGVHFTSSHQPNFMLPLDMLSTCYTSLPSKTETTDTIARRTLSHRLLLEGFQPHGLKNTLPVEQQHHEGLQTAPRPNDLGLIDACETSSIALVATVSWFQQDDASFSPSPRPASRRHQTAMF